MNKLLSTIILGIFMLATLLPQNAISGKIISGAGATFPYPVYSKWAYAYFKLTGIKINYQSIGSGGGIRQIKAKTVDFGASDAPLKAEELEKAGLIQFPMIIGGVVPVINLKEIGDHTLQLDGKTLADIFLGKVQKWNDPRIAEMNPDVKLPNRRIRVIHRSDGSGTTWIFSKYLSAVNKEWAEKVGAGKALKWPTGYGGKGNEGVAAYVKSVKGSIGYVEYAYAIQIKLKPIALKNRDGNFIYPSIESFQAAATNADWAGTPGMAVILVNQPGEKTWPITGASFILMHKIQEEPETAKITLEFFHWCYFNGADMALKLHYVPLPLEVVKIVEELWAKEIKTPDGKPIWHIKGDFTKQEK